ncbi:hypothetical protein AB0M28_14595 [Streptomyces sp. NPDC051940]|uniref:vWA-MoxR associated conflict system protein n=1 Tax=Streptomyces sp. NPDC051940 TaxID=3155675 RepID=UPI003416826D
MSTPGTVKRHVLVVGAQCEGTDALAELEDAARSLHAVLVDPELGGCTERDGSLLVETAPGRDAVVAAVGRAARAAARDGAVLVLAFVGHGEGSEGGPLYFVTTGRRGSPGIENVDLPSLLGSVLNHPGLAGLVAVVDACHAAAASIDAATVVRGVREGDVQLSMLYASAAQENAWDLSLTTELVKVLREGLPQAGGVLEIDDTLRDRLRKRVRGQLPARDGYSGGRAVPGLLWLARNNAAPSAGSAGRFALEALADACRAVDPSLDPGLGLAGLSSRLDAAPQADWVARERLRELIAALRVGRSALETVKASAGDELTEEAVRLAAALAGYPHAVVWRDPPLSLRDAVEYAAVNPDARDEQHRLLARFLAALTYAMGRPELPAAWVAWMQRQPVPLETARTWLRDLATSSRDDGARLVLVLSTDGDDAVARVRAWLLHGRAVIGRDRFPCPRGELGLPTALDDAVRWAKERIGALGLRLLRMDVSAPALMLLHGPLEDQPVGPKRRRLGVDYNVVARWSGLLEPPPGTDGYDLVEAGQRLLSVLDESADCRPQWLTDTHLASLEALLDELGVRGRGEAVWGVSRLPEADWELMALELLIHSPAMLWPRSNDGCEAKALRDAVHEHWDALPGRLTDAYRRSLQARGAHPPEPLALVGVAWHDEHWQVFCQKQASRSVVAP